MSHWIKLLVNGKPNQKCKTISYSPYILLFFSLSCCSVVVDCNAFFCFSSLTDNNYTNHHSCEVFFSYVSLAEEQPNCLLPFKKLVFCAIVCDNQAEEEEAPVQAMSEMLYTQTIVDCRDHLIAANQMYRNYFSNLLLASGPIYCIYQESLSCFHSARMGVFQPRRSRFRFVHSSV